jgi:amino acid transporter
MFSWLAAFGGFALAVIYLLMSLGALRGLRDHDKQWAVRLAAAVGIVVTAGAIYGSIYKVTKPNIYAPYAAVAILLIGLIVGFVRAGRNGAHAASRGSATAKAASSEANI